MGIFSVHGVTEIFLEIRDRSSYLYSKSPAWSNETTCVYHFSSFSNPQLYSTIISSLRNGRNGFIEQQNHTPCSGLLKLDDTRLKYAFCFWIQLWWSPRTDTVSGHDMEASCSLSCSRQSQEHSFYMACEYRCPSHQSTVTDWR